MKKVILSDENFVVPASPRRGHPATHLPILQPHGICCDFTCAHSRLDTQGWSGCLRSQIETFVVPAFRALWTRSRRPAQLLAAWHPLPLHLCMHKIIRLLTPLRSVLRQQASLHVLIPVVNSLACRPAHCEATARLHADVLTEWCGKDTAPQGMCSCWLLTAWLAGSHMAGQLQGSI